jgi:SAM-dependent methyltransferase
MSSFWDREVVERHHVEWMSLPAVRAYLNRAIGGDAPRWPIDWFQSWLHGRRFARALSIGCGAGALERDLIRHGLCDTIDAFDGSITSLHLAREAAREFGNRIRYFAADFNRCALPRRCYDIVFFHQSAHHVARLERLFADVLDAVKADGLVYLDEYVGPSRFDWTEERMAPQREFFDAIPAALRRVDRLSLPIQADDPSEAVRSSDIEDALGIGFKVVARRPYGGTLLSIVLPSANIALLDDASLAYFIGCERALLAAGMPSFYALIVARPHRGARRLWAKFHYLLLRVGRRFKAIWTRYQAQT